jgi:predicted Zn finger-like uncharacterized protein
MIVTCPSCKRRYKIDDGNLNTPKKMRCSKCGNVFVNEPPGGTGEKPVDYAERIGAIPPAASQLKERKGVHKGLAFAVISLLVLLALAGGGYIYWQDYLGAGNQYLVIKKLEGQEMFIQDSKIFLVTGVVQNKSTKPRRYVFLKCRLIGKDGSVIGERFAPAGLSVSKNDAERMARADLEKSRIPNEGLVLDKGREIPFTIAYLDVEFGKAKEFTVEIYEAPQP